MTDRSDTREIETDSVPIFSNRIEDVDEEGMNNTKPNNAISIHENYFSDLKIKDVGYAWIVLAAMFTSNILTTGYIKGFGIIYNKIHDVYPDATGTIAGVMMGLLSGFRSMFAPFAGALGNIFGVRKTMFCGVLIYCTGLLGSYFCTNVYQLLFTAGAMIGLSHCIIESLQITVISQYFDSKLSMANGIRVAGHPCGGMLYPFMLTFLLQSYGLRWSFVLLAGLTTHIFVCALLIRPIEVHTKIKVIDFVKKVGRGKEQASVNLMAEEPSSVLPKSKAEIVEDYMNHNVFSSDKKKRPLEFRYFLDVSYLFYIFMAAGIPIALPLVLYYMTICAKKVIGLSPYEISILLSYQALFDFLLRIIIGWLNNKKLYKEAYGFIFCLWISAAGSMLMSIADGLPHLFFAVTLFSFGPASYHACVNVILCNQFGKDSISSTWGFVRMTQGIFSFIHPVLIGYLVDTTGGYTVPFLVMGMGLLFCSLMITLSSVLSWIEERNLRNR